MTSLTWCGCRCLSDIDDRFSVRVLNKFIPSWFFYCGIIYLLFRIRSYVIGLIVSCIGWFFGYWVRPTPPSYGRW